jgi:lycopene cyclase domain-containing protein
MLGSWTYLIWLALFVALPIAGLAAWGGRVWWRERRALAWTLLGAAVGGWAWDYTAIQLGFWSFTDTHKIGIHFLGLPLEEWLWILGVSWMFAGLALILHARRPPRDQAPPIPQTSLFAHLPLTLAFIPTHLSQLTMLLGAGLVFHSILWFRNAPFLRKQLRTILLVTAAAVVWLLLTDPIGAFWGAWHYDPDRVIGIWIFGLIPGEDVLGAIVVGSAAACSALVFAHGPRRGI